MTVSGDQDSELTQVDATYIPSDDTNLQQGEENVMDEDSYIMTNQ